MYMHDTTVVCIWNDGICWTNVCGMETWYWNWTIHAEPSRALFGYPVGVSTSTPTPLGKLRWAKTSTIGATRMGFACGSALTTGARGQPRMAQRRRRELPHHRRYALNYGTTATSTRWTSLRPRSERPTTPQHTAHAACIHCGQALPRRWTSKPTAAGPPL